MKSIFLSLAVWLAVNCGQAAPFINLDFEMVDTNAIVGYPFPFEGGGAPLSVVMPGWAINGRTDGSLPFNGSPCFDSYCSVFVSSEGLSVPNSYARFFFPNGMHGHFGMGIVAFPNFAITLSQRGDVPMDAKYLFLDVHLSTFAAFGIFIDGVRQTSYDISAFAGKNINLELKFGATPQSPGPSMPPATVGLDAVVFLVPPKLEAPSSSPGTNGFTLSWTNDVSTRYQVEFATNFPATWKPIGAPVASTNGTFHFLDTSATNQAIAQRFYRLRLAP